MGHKQVSRRSLRPGDVFTHNENSGAYGSLLWEVGPDKLYARAYKSTEDFNTQIGGTPIYLVKGKHFVYCI